MRSSSSTRSAASAGSACSGAGGDPSVAASSTPPSPQASLPISSHSLLSRRHLGGGGAAESLRVVLPPPTVSMRLAAPAGSENTGTPSPPKEWLLASSPEALPVVGQKQEPYAGVRSSGHAAAVTWRARRAPEDGGSGSALARSRPTAVPSARRALSPVHEGTVAGPWATRYQDRRGPAPASFAAQAGTARPGTSGTADSSKPADSPSFMGSNALTQWKEDLKTQAIDVYFQRHADIYKKDKQARERTDLSPSYVSRSTREELNELKSKLVKKIASIEKSAPGADSTEPQLRIVGFCDSPSSSPS
jgi:hypothetical protein